MNLYYVFSVAFGRFSSLISLLLFSYFFTARHFGTYSSIATNALLVNLLSGAWIVNFAWKEISQCDAKQLPQVYYEVIRLIVATVCIIFTLTIAALFVFPMIPTGQWIVATAIWGMTTLAFDAALVATNANGDSKTYANLTLLRGTCGLGLSILFILSGFDFWGAVAGQVMANVGVLLCNKETRAKWHLAEKPLFARFDLRAAMKFGVASVVALNIYMIVNAVSRNTILIALGPENAGYASLAADLFYAPVALFAMSISLSKIPELYRAAGERPELADDSAVHFILSNIAVIFPYILGGIFLAAGIASHILDAKMIGPVGSIAALAVIQSGCLGLLSTFTTIALTSGRVATAVMRAA